MREAIARGEAGVLTYGITPPRQSSPPERVRATAAAQTARINGLPVDGLVIYDLQDESSRTDVERPFPYEECIDPVDYAYDHLREVAVPKVTYKCVAKLDAAALGRSLKRIHDEGGLCVLVGAASRHDAPTLSLSAAYELRQAEWPDVPTGGVLIGERHRNGQREHERVLGKVAQGCSFFVTQAVYSPDDTKDVLSDLHYRCRDTGEPFPPVLVTLTPCGSAKTLTFLRWLGVAIPRWLENELLHADDTLGMSLDLCEQVFADLHAYATARGIPLGCNVESVSLRKDEIEASVDLVGRVARIMGRR